LKIELFEFSCAEAEFPVHVLLSYSNCYYRLTEVTRRQQSFIFFVLQAFSNLLCCL
jgi:hypothetical protein